MTRHTDTAGVARSLALGALVCLVLLVLGYLGFVWTAFGHQIDANAYFGRDLALHRVLNYDNHILAAVSEVSLALIAVVVFAVAWIRRAPLVGLIAVIGIGVAVVGAEVLKDVLPWEPLVPMDADYTGGLTSDAYPSGHTTIGTSVALAFVLVLPARMRPWLAVLAGFVSASYATGVVFAGWHRPSDAIGGICWAGACMCVAAWAAVRTRGNRAPLVGTVGSHAALLGSLATGVVVVLISLAGTLFGFGNYPDADMSFVAVVILIVAAAFTLTAWFGWRLQSIDWVPVSEPAEAPAVARLAPHQSPGDTSGMPKSW